MTTAELNKEEQQTKENSEWIDDFKKLLEESKESDKVILRHKASVEFLELVDMSGVYIIKEDTDEARNVNTEKLTSRSKKDLFSKLSNEYFKKLEQAGLLKIVSRVSGGPITTKQLVLEGLVGSLSSILS